MHSMVSADYRYGNLGKARGEGDLMAALSAIGDGNGHDRRAPPSEQACHQGVRHLGCGQSTFELVRRQEHAHAHTRYTTLH